ncbi:MAG: hypothetical protein M5U16_02305 [Hyphomicrobium sp.]|nr:hypothetical protein [Hyphomicrobium sp.]
MLIDPARRIVSAALAVALLAASGDRARAQSSEPKQDAPSEAEEILKESRKNDPETPKEIAECMKEWGPQTQMTKEEWAASCRSTLRYFPESP